MQKAIQSNNPDALQLGPKVKQVVLYYFEHPEMTQRQLAAVFKLSEARISGILTSPRVLDAYPILARRKLKSMVPRAIRRYNQLLEQNENLVVSEKVTTRVLDSQKILNPVEVHHKHSLSDATIDDLHRIINESKLVTGPVIDGEIVSDMANPLDNPTQP